MNSKINLEVELRKALGWGAPNCSPYTKNQAEELPAPINQQFMIL